MASSIQSRLDDYRRMRLGYLRILAFHVEQVPPEIGEPRQSIQVDLLKGDCSEKIALEFAGVQDLKIERIHPGTTCQLEIVSIVDHQLEGLRFQVFNGEPQDFELSFYCVDFAIKDLPID